MMKVRTALHILYVNFIFQKLEIILKRLKDYIRDFGNLKRYLASLADHQVPNHRKTVMTHKVTEPQYEDEPRKIN